MTTEPSKKTEQADVRANLICAAYTCFTASDYDKVSIRQISELADVNMAMIRYYFGSKLGLFEAMVSEHIQPIHRRAKALQQSHDKLTLADIMGEFYQTMIPNPEFPRFLFQLMNSEHSVEAKGVIFKLFEPIAELTPMPHKLLEGWGELDPQMLKMSLLSLMIFPFVMPIPMAKLHGYQLNEEFYQQMAKHNIALLENGICGGKR